MIRKQILLAIAFVVFTSLSSYAQQALWGAPGIVSPEVKADNTVTFRFQAPNAKEVKIMGDWMPGQGPIPGSETMTKDEKGIWSYSTPVVPSDLYGYSFSVDGLKTT